MIKTRMWWIPILLVLNIGWMPAEKNHPELILVGGKILAEGFSHPLKGGIAVGKGRIVAVGENSQMRKLAGPKTRIVELHGGTVVAGLHDAHVHFESGSKMLTQRLSVRYMNLEQILEQVRIAIQNSPPGALIKAYHFNQAYFPDKEWPSRRDLDRVAPENPVVISRVDGHSVWVNSLALLKAGIHNHTPDPPGGEIQRDENGEATGILKENAEKLVENLAGPKMVVPGRDSQNPLLAGIRHANRLGLTSVTTSGSRQLIQELKSLQRQGQLTLRFHVWLNGENLETHLQEGLSYNQGDAFIRVAFLKIFADGTIGSATAAMFQPYLHRPDSRGILIHPPDKLDSLVANAHRHGWPVGVHAIGNRGVQLVLNAVEKAQSRFGKSHLRHRIEHSQFVMDEDIRRYGSLGVVASMQPTHCTTDLLVVEDRIGHDRARQGYRWRSFLKKDVTLAFGTDWPIEPLDPRRGLYSSVERRNIETGIPQGKGWFPGEAITLVEALRAYSLGSAQAVSREQELGVIAPGKLADLTVFSGDILQISHENPRRILTQPVTLTVVHGKVVYQR